MATLQEILGTPRLIERVNMIKPGLAADLLPDAFYSTTVNITGNVGSYDRTIGERRAARTTRYSAPSQAQESLGVSNIPVNLLHAAEHIAISPNVMLMLREEGNDKLQARGIMELARRLADQKQRFTNLRTLAIQLMLSTGKLYAGVAGTLQTTSTSAMTSADFGIPAGNQGQLNVFSAGPIITASWATVGTSIQTQIRNLKIAARRLTGFPIKHAFFGVNVMTYLLNNTEYSTYFRHNSAAQDALKRGEIPDALASLTWHPMGEAFMLNEGVPQGGAVLEAGTTAGIWDPDLVVFTPEIDGSWYDMIQGSELLPDGMWEGKSAQEILDSMEEVFGLGVYAKLEDDPVQLKSIMVDTFLPVIKVPKAIFQATVKF